MEFENQEEDQRHEVEAVGRESPQHHHRDEHWHFHKEPRHLIVDEFAPTGRDQHPIAGLHKIERYKHDDSNDRHHDEKNIKY